MYHIADAAFYTEQNLKSIGTHMFWISRVPSTWGEAQKLLDQEITFLLSTDPRYTWHSKKIEVAGSPQNWVIYQSAEMQERTEKTFEKNLLKETDEVRKSLKHL